MVCFSLPSSYFSVLLSGRSRDEFLNHLVLSVKSCGFSHTGDPLRSSQLLGFTITPVTFRRSFNSYIFLDQ